MMYEFELGRGDMKIVTIDEEPGWLRVDVQIGSGEGVHLYSAQARVAVKGDYRIETRGDGLAIRVGGLGLLGGRRYEF